MVLPRLIRAILSILQEDDSCSAYSQVISRAEKRELYLLKRRRQKQATTFIRHIREHICTCGQFIPDDALSAHQTKAWEDGLYDFFVSISHSVTNKDFPDIVFFIRRQGLSSLTDIQNSLFDAVCSDDCQSLASLLERFAPIAQLLLNSRDPLFRWTPVQLAAFNGSARVLDYLFSSGSSPNSIPHPLSLAAERLHSGCVLSIIRHQGKRPRDSTRALLSLARQLKLQNWRRRMTSRALVDFAASLLDSPFTLWQRAEDDVPVSAPLFSLVVYGNDDDLDRWVISVAVTCPAEDWDAALLHALLLRVIQTDRVLGVQHLILNFKNAFPSELLLSGMHAAIMKGAKKVFAYFSDFIVLDTAALQLCLYSAVLVAKADPSFLNSLLGSHRACSAAAFSGPLFAPAPLLNVPSFVFSSALSPVSLCCLLGYEVAMTQMLSMCSKSINDVDSSGLNPVLCCTLSTSMPCLQLLRKHFDDTDFRSLCNSTANNTNQSPLDCLLQRVRVGDRRLQEKKEEEIADMISSLVPVSRERQLQTGGSDLLRVALARKWTKYKEECLILLDKLEGSSETELESMYQLHLKRIGLERHIERMMTSRDFTLSLRLLARTRFPSHSLINLCHSVCTVISSGDLDAISSLDKRWKHFKALCSSFSRLEDLCKALVTRRGVGDLTQARKQSIRQLLLLVTDVSIEFLSKTISEVELGRMSRQKAAEKLLFSWISCAVLEDEIVSSALQREVYVFALKRDELRQTLESANIVSSRFSLDSGTVAIASLLSSEPIDPRVSGLLSDFDHFSSEIGLLNSTGTYPIYASCNRVDLLDSILSREIQTGSTMSTSFPFRSLSMVGLCLRGLWRAATAFIPQAFASDRHKGVVATRGSNSVEVCGAGFDKYDELILVSVLDVVAESRDKGAADFLVAYLSFANIFPEATLTNVYNLISHGHFEAAELLLTRCWRLCPDPATPDIHLRDPFIQDSSTVAGGSIQVSRVQVLYTSCFAQC